MLLLNISAAVAGCAGNSTPILERREMAQPNISHLQVVTDEDPQVQRFRRALVSLCVQEPSLSPAVIPTATKPAHEYPGTNELHIDLWRIDTAELTFQLATASEKPIWIVSGMFVEQNDAYVADATISERHYQ
ncbi:hypothetical protein [Stieleria neptunia]|uniref:hypothetical protein n=1 Tax=Stieleria neptunia TaxID=2527979 RepID=UPI0011A70D5B|nr:hypothetical protein [Stieleria neptunia]